GMARSEQGLKQAISDIRALRAEFWSDLFVPGSTNEYNPEFEKAWRVADFLELGELMCQDALHRNESCGGHFREEYQTDKGEALRDDQNFMYVAAWEWKGESQEAQLHKEALNYEEIEVAQRSYE
ncbi:MAG: fumarate reductase/succinate dehydrogenase flavoprotein subunit, partial [Bacteroidota bacterium]